MTTCRVPAPDDAHCSIRLSTLFRDTAVRQAFDRAERDDGHAFPVPAEPNPTLIDGAAKPMEMA